jgi:1-acyl-sn-glycerol-3-phosphate acyltransferase
MSIFAKTQRSAAGKALLRLFRVEVINPQNEPDEGVYIITSNHTSNYDPIVLGAVTKRPIRYMAKKQLFHIPLLKQLITAFGAYPVDRAGSDVGAVKTSIDLLKRGEIVGMYMESTRRRGVPQLRNFKHGTAMIARRAEVGILPVTVYTKKGKVSMFRKTRVVFGELITAEQLSEIEGGQSAVTEYVAGIIIDEYKRQAENS